MDVVELDPESDSFEGLCAAERRDREALSEGKPPRGEAWPFQSLAGPGYAERKKRKRTFGIRYV